MWQAIAVLGPGGYVASSTRLRKYAWFHMIQPTPRRNLTLSTLALVLAAVATPGQHSPARSNLVVHEWGTFTCLQDEDGRAIGGVNAEDEPLPAFVHRPAVDLLLRAGDLAPCFFQGAPSCHPDVTMRLETPVVYFHLPDGAEPLQLDVGVAWTGGWLTEYYPRGEAEMPGIGETPLGRVKRDAVGTLRWRGVRVGGAHPGPTTDRHVWLAPRRVDANDVRVGDEAERFLFYRGVGNVDSPLLVRRDAERHELVLHGKVVGAALRTGPIWLVDIDREKGTAFRELPPLTLPSNSEAVLGRMPARFDANDYARGNLDPLRTSMRRALITDGLFEDEADALLETWKLSYFESDGMRLFFLVPRAWTDRVMPLSLSVPAQVERVMVGRIEIVSERQRELLAQIAAGPASDGTWLNEYISELALKDHERFDAVWKRLLEEPGAVLSLGLDVPKDYRAWLALGRFRYALILEEQRHRPTEALRTFASNYSLEL